MRSQALDAIALQLRQGRSPGMVGNASSAGIQQGERAVIEAARQRTPARTIVAATMHYFGRGEER